MLVLTTLFIANLNSLPRTPNIKMMDVWFIFTLLIPFTEVLLHTAIAALQVLLSLDLFVFFYLPNSNHPDYRMRVKQKI